MSHRYFACFFLGSLLLVSGCQTVSFYHQAAVGQSRLMLARQSTAQLVQATTTDPALRERLIFVNDVLGFASELGLHHRGSFQSYVETGQDFVIWNVFAAAPDQLSLEQSCFPIAGCVSYRGYFQLRHARREALRLSELGFDVYVGGVKAYSTLGWFDDPLLDTFLFQPDDTLAALIFHELAHQLIYVAGDTRFNESLATAVERYALGQWFARRGEIGALDRWQRARERQDVVIGLIDDARQSLRSLYLTNNSPVDMDRQKAQIIDDLRLRYHAQIADWKGQGIERLPFQSWMAGEINNAKLETVADYTAWVPGLNRLADDHGFEALVRRLSGLAEMSMDQRAKALTQLQQRALGPGADPD